MLESTFMKTGLILQVYSLLGEMHKISVELSDFVFCSIIVLAVVKFYIFKSYIQYRGVLILERFQVAAYTFERFCISLETLKKLLFQHLNNALGKFYYE